MKTLLAAALMALAAGSAVAQTRQPSLTLYDQPGFKGRSVTLYADNLDLSDTGVVGKTRSAQVNGRWRVCNAPGWGGRCRSLERNIADLAALDFAGQVVSAALDMGYSRESYAPDPYAYDVEDYSAPPPQPRPQPYAAPARRPEPAPAYRPVPRPQPAQPPPPSYPYPDYGGGPAFGPASR